jgi:hypothetical protein
MTKIDKTTYEIYSMFVWSYLETLVETFQNVFCSITLPKVPFKMILKTSRVFLQMQILQYLLKWKFWVLCWTYKYGAEDKYFL